MPPPVHTFDTGANKAQRTRIREAVLAKLAPLRKLAVPARYITALKELPRPYGGDGDHEGLEMLKVAFNGQAPSIGVALGRLPLSPAGMEATDLGGELDVFVYAYSQQGRDPLLVDGRLAADVVAEGSLTADPGVETMLEHALELLAGQELAIAGVAEMRAESEDVVATFGDFTVGELKFTIRVDRNINPARGTDELLTSIQTELSSTDIPDDTAQNDQGEDLVPLTTTVTNLDPPEA